MADFVVFGLQDGLAERGRLPQPVVGALVRLVPDQVPDGDADSGDGNDDGERDEEGEAASKSQRLLPSSGAGRRGREGKANRRVVATAPW
jgi:hypothetical protein